MSEEQPVQESRRPSALSREELDQTVNFFRERLVGQPEVVEALTNVLFKQNALLKRILEVRDTLDFSNDSIGEVVDQTRNQPRRAGPEKRQSD